MLFFFEGTDKGLRIFIAERIADGGNRFGGVAQHVLGFLYEEVMNGHSKIRNKGIANIFSQMGLVEAWGSGAIWRCPGITGNSCHCLKSLFQS